MIYCGVVLRHPAVSPVATTHFFGYVGTEVFLYRGGRRTPGYAVMGLFIGFGAIGREVRLPVMTAICFTVSVSLHHPCLSCRAIRS